MTIDEISTVLNKNNTFDILFTRSNRLDKKEGMKNKRQMLKSATKGEKKALLNTSKRKVYGSISHKNQPGKVKKHKVRSHLLPGI